MKRGMRYAAIAVALCGCTSLDEGARQEFSRHFTCPESSITVTERSDLDADEIERGPIPDPPAEVKADPTRLALWNQQHQPIHTGHTIYQAAGCDHEVFYSCGRSKKSHPMCFATEYQTKTAKKPALPTLATLSSAALEGNSNPIDAPPMVGELTSFDVDANLDWATTIATAWSPDVKLYRIMISSMKPDGTLDVSPKGRDSVLYQFNSAAKGDVDFTVDVTSLGGQRTPPFGVGKHDHRDPTTRDPITKPKCTLVKALAGARAGVLKGTDPKYRLAFVLDVQGGKEMWNTEAVIADKSQWVKIDAATCATVK
jgi:hypothetical protein